MQFPVYTASTLVILATAVEFPQIFANVFVYSYNHKLSTLNKLSDAAYRITSRIYEFIHRRRPNCVYDVLFSAEKPQNHSILELQSVKVEKNDKLFPQILDLSGQSEYQRLGFQNSDPSSDIRGSGRLGLLHLHNLAQNPTFPRLVEESNEGNWYPLALISIRFSKNLTDHLNEVPHFQRISDSQLADLHNSTVIDFHEVWKAEQPSIMELEKFIAEFETGSRKEIIRKMVGYYN